MLSCSRSQRKGVGQGPRGVVVSGSHFLRHSGSQTKLELAELRIGSWGGGGRGAEKEGRERREEIEGVRRRERRNKEKE